MLNLDDKDRQIADLEKQLAEKDKEIAKIRHQVCEEIREYIYSYNDKNNHRPQICNEYIEATCKDILEKLKEIDNERL